MRALHDELDELNREISRTIGSVMSRSDEYRSRFVRMGERRELELHASDDESLDTRLGTASRLGMSDEEASVAYLQKDNHRPLSKKCTSPAMRIPAS